jgi:hypothetical protein
MKIGDKVKMSQSLKDGLMENGCQYHVYEFGECIGIVEDMVWHNDEGDEWNVRWLPSMLRYGYSPDELVVILKEERKEKLKKINE